MNWWYWILRFLSFRLELRNSWLLVSKIQLIIQIPRWSLRELNLSVFSFYVSFFFFLFFFFIDAKHLDILAAIQKENHFASTFIIQCDKEILSSTSSHTGPLLTPLHEVLSQCIVWVCYCKGNLCSSGLVILIFNRSPCSWQNLMRRAGTEEPTLHLVLELKEKLKFSISNGSIYLFFCLIGYGSII